MSTGAGSSEVTPTPRSRSPRADAQRNREALLAAARAVFQRDGAAAQMDDIASQAGVGIGTLYRNFPTKEALINTFVEENHNAIVHSAEKAAQAPHAWEGLQAFLWEYVQLQAENRAISDFFLDATRLREYREPSVRYYDLINPVVKRAQTCGQIRQDISARDILIAASMLGKMTHYGLDQSGARWRRVLKVFLEGLEVGAGSGMSGVGS